MHITTYYNIIQLIVVVDGSWKTYFGLQTTTAAAAATDENKNGVWGSRVPRADRRDRRAEFTHYSFDHHAR